MLTLHDTLGIPSVALRMRIQSDAGVLTCDIHEPVFLSHPAVVEALERYTCFSDTISVGSADLVPADAENHHSAAYTASDVARWLKDWFETDNQTSAG